MQPGPPLGAAVPVDPGQGAPAVVDLGVVDPAPKRRRREGHDLGGGQELALPRQLGKRVQRSGGVGEGEVPGRTAQAALLDDDVAAREPSLLAGRRRPEAGGRRLGGPVCGEHREPAVCVRPGVGIGGGHDLVVEPVAVPRRRVGERGVPDLEAVALPPPAGQAQRCYPTTLHIRT